MPAACVEVHAVSGMLIVMLAISLSKTCEYVSALQMEQLMLDCLLPAMCMVPALTPLANDIWGALNLLDCTDRWRMYTALKVIAA